MCIKAKWRCRNTEGQSKKKRKKDEVIELDDCNTMGDSEGSGIGGAGVGGEVV